VTGEARSSNFGVAVVLGLLVSLLLWALLIALALALYGWLA